jgi:glycosyltransferase involved in cell wall biosynthesis
MITMLKKSVSVGAVVVALDVPLQEQIMEKTNVPGDTPYVGLFPLEGPPLCMSWAMQLMRMDERLCMSRFGCEEMAAVGVPSTFIPIGIDCAAWRPAQPEEREQIRRALGMPEDSFIVLTVADNQERKNLSRTLEIFAHFSLDVIRIDSRGEVTASESKRETQWHLVTRPKSPVGYRLQDYAMRKNITERLMMYNRGIPFKSLWSLFAAADAFLLTSKAEGLAMPVLEAMACRLPVVATDCTAINEHLRDGRGLLIPHDYIMVDPWGNSLRYFASLRGGVDALENLVAMQNGDKVTMLDKAEAYVQGRTWTKAADVLEVAIKRAIERKANDG